jgi:hypothetical protein
MDYQAIAISVLLPAVVSVGVAIINNQRQKRVEFEYDYKRYVLQKRKQIYETVEDLIASFNKYSFADLYLGNIKGVIEELQPKFVFLAANDIWITQFMQNSLRSAEALLEEIERYVDSSGVTAATKNRLVQQWRQVKATLVDDYFEDIMRLNQIDAFKKLKIKQYKYSIKFLEEEVNQASLSEAIDDFKGPLND